MNDEEQEMELSMDDVRSSDMFTSINEIASQITCDVNNMIEDFIVSNVNEYGSRYHNWVQVNAEKICEAIMKSREDKKTEHDVKLETLKTVKERAQMLYDMYFLHVRITDIDFRDIAFRDLIRELRETIDELEKSNE